MRRFVKELTKSLARKIFVWGQYLGFDLLPRHFYSEIPDIRVLRREGHWKQAYSMTGVSGTDPAAQLAFVGECCPPDMVEELTSADVYAAAVAKNGEEGFGPVEADFLYAFLTARKPTQIFQIGCGVSTAVCQAAAQRSGYRPDLICLEPYPTDFLRSEAEDGSLTLLEKKAQDLALAVIEGLDEDVLFFVDSSHALGPAGEVSRIILEMLPRLKAGAFVHFHDIRFPYDYERDVLDAALFFQHESSLLHAFLVHNSRFKLCASLSMLHYDCPAQLKAYLPNYEPADNDYGLRKGKGHFPSSTYLEVV